MLDKELFFSLCEKYNVELSKTAKAPMIRDAEGVHAITEEDVKQSFNKSCTLQEIKKTE